MISTGTGRVRPPLARADLDWPRLYREGLRVRVGSGARAEASGFVVPFAADEDLLVLLIPCRRGLTGSMRELLEHGASIARNGRGLVTWLQGIGRILG